ncbi:hypothetical protein VCHA51O444_30060 [Vibrio chagasii]|nr:hypothetical protein VCHA51O444_30060 [Vibrio chagasii]
MQNKSVGHLNTPLSRGVITGTEKLPPSIAKVLHYKLTACF